MKNFDVAVIGGCSSGLIAAINAKRLYPDLRIAVFEALPKAGKKILATGNGRCNLTNLNAGSHNYTNKEFAEYALTKYNVSKTLGIFEALGLKTYTDSEGRVYPYSNNASSVLDALRFGLKGIDLICDFKINKIVKTDNIFILNDKIEAAKVIIACGGKASPSQGSDGSGYNLAKSLGHNVTPLYPSLVPIIADSKITKPLKGVRIHKASVTIISGGKPIANSCGELLFTENGLSGIVAMELASQVEETVKNVKCKCFASIDFTPDLSEEELLKYLKKVSNSSTLRTFDSLLTGIIPKAAGAAVCKACNLYNDESDSLKLSDNQIKLLEKAIKDFKIEVKSSRGFDAAQVTKGGIKTSEINPETMESRICSDLFFAGEIIDVDGGCGGFNLQWAWSSGLLAGELGGKI